MLNLLFRDPLSLGLAQAGVTALLAMAVAYGVRWWGIRIEREAAGALVRAILQVVAVGLVIGVLLQGPAWTSVFVLAGMVVAAAAIAARRARKLPGAFWDTLRGVGIGSGVVILLMVFAGVMELEVASLVPVGSMIVANAMNSASLALDRFRAEVEGHTGQIEAGLALGADPTTMVAPYVQKAVEASLIPRVDTLRSLGIVWIPGVMAGMILSGSDPVYAAVYQFAVLAMILAAAGIASVITLVLLRHRAFSVAAQLTLRPGQAGQGRR